MKFSIFTTVALSLTVAAVPHRRIQHKHNKREAVVEVVTDVVTQTAPVAMVYVNQAGEPQWTSWQTGGHGHGHHRPTTTPSPTSAAPSNAPSSPESSLQGPTPESSAAAVTGSSAPPAYSSPPAQSSDSAAPAPSAPSGGSGSGSGSWGMGLSYSPYNGDGSCKSQDEVNSDVGALSGYGMLRIYGTDCDQASTVLQAATANGMKIFAGIYDITQVASEAATLIAAAKGNWDAIDTVSVGNEVVNSGGSAAAVVAAVKQARILLQAAGYNGKVVTVDTFTAIIDNPSLCEVSDFAAANCHAFFDADITADQAGSYVAQQAANVKKACGGKDTVITESGWPSQGSSNGVAVPSEANQKAAISSLRAAFSDNMVLFSAYNDLWKTNTADTFNAEQYWGIYGMAPSA